MKRHSGIAMDWIRCIAEVGNVAKRERLSAGHGNFGIAMVPIPGQRATAGEESSQQIFVELDVDRAQSHIRRIVRAIIGNGGVVIVKIETTANIRPVRQRPRRLDSPSQRGNGECSVQCGSRLDLDLGESDRSK